VGAILVMILLANVTAARATIRPTGWPFAGLLLALMALAFFPTAIIAGLTVVPRVVIGALFLAAPVYFSGLIFVTLWARALHKDMALGSNLGGALLGGVLGNLSMLLGFRALTLCALVIYLVVGLRLARQDRQR
ncbi:MAG: hypothetical protein HY815_02140, partial [Candidatus Riflebacteria bacterium]|nr:hypothetical protein [Candidatus Riflebacteria bacterium]